MDLKKWQSKFRSAFGGPKKKEQKKNGQDQSEEARRKRALSRAKNKRKYYE
jgi:hypothetical protein